MAAKKTRKLVIRYERTQNVTEPSPEDRCESELVKCRDAIDEMKEELLRIHAERQNQVCLIRERATRYTHRWTVGLRWGVHLLSILMTGLVIWLISVSNEYPFGSLSWVLAVLGVLGFLVSFMPQVTAVLAKGEQNRADRRSRSKLFDAGFSPDEVESRIKAHGRDIGG